MSSTVTLWRLYRHLSYGVNNAKISYVRNGKSIFVEWARNGDNVAATINVDGFTCLCGDTLLRQGENTLNLQVR